MISSSVQALSTAEGQKNALVRIVLRALDKSLTDEECNIYRDRIYAYLHQGKKWEWATENGKAGKYNLK